MAKYREAHPDGVPILYSWPSQESLTPVGYSTDAQTDWTAPHLRWFLEDIATRYELRGTFLLWGQLFSHQRHLSPLDKFVAPTEAASFA